MLRDDSNSMETANRLYLKYSDPGFISNILSSWKLETNSKCPIISTKIKYLTPTKIIHNGPVTVVFWDDDTKTLVRRNEECEDDPYLAFCAALAKKIYGNNTRVKKLITENTVEPKERKKK